MLTPPGHKIYQMYWESYVCRSFEEFWITYIVKSFAVVNEDDITLYRVFNWRAFIHFLYQSLQRT